MARARPAKPKTDPAQRPRALARAVPQRSPAAKKGAAKKPSRPKAQPREPARASEPAPAGIPSALLAKLRSICSRLPKAYEERAWVGVRWMIAKRTFAHVVKIQRGWPPAYARAAESDGPILVLTFRASELLRDVLDDAGPRFFRAEWGTKWGTKVIGVKLDAAPDWSELEALITESYRFLAPKKLAALAPSGLV